MDNPGWHAQRRAQKENEAYNREYRRSGIFQPVEYVSPVDEALIGSGNYQPPSPRPPIPAPQDYLHVAPHDHRPHETAPSEFPNAPYPPPNNTVSPEQLAQMSALERSEALRGTRMQPHLQFMCGPLLKYDTIDEHGIWHGAALIVTADSGSIYKPHPTLTYTWDPQHIQIHDSGVGGFVRNGGAIHMLGVPPAKGNGVNSGPCSQQVRGQELWVYATAGGSFTFWRFTIKIPLAAHEMEIQYSVNNGYQIQFWVPGRGENMRWAAHSCNGFSAGIKQEDFCGPGFKSGYDPVWTDLLAKHSESPFHVLVGGGDQLYCDALTHEPEMQDWVSQKPEEKRVCKLTKEMELAIDRFFFNHYCRSFTRGAFARANCSIPMLNMCDDHDRWIRKLCAPCFALFTDDARASGAFTHVDVLCADPDDLQKAPVFRQIGARGYFFFLLFQCFIHVEVDGLEDAPGKHVYQSLILGEPGPYVRFPSHSFLSRLGPKVYILLLDCRAERRKDQVCSPGEYERVLERLSALPVGVEHVIVQLGIPIAYPSLVHLERVLESKHNPLVALAKKGVPVLSEFLNEFNAEPELLDDLNDHWTAQNHVEERNWFIEQLQNFAKVKRIRVTFLSGDVHCAAVGVLKTHKGWGKPELQPIADYRYMVNIISSAIVNKPPPNGVILMVTLLAMKADKPLRSIDTDENMEPIFGKEPMGGSRMQKLFMARRNWCRVEWDEQTGAMVFDIRVEKEQGVGVTAGYPMRVPPPGW